MAASGAGWGPLWGWGRSGRGAENAQPGGGCLVGTQGGEGLRRDMLGVILKGLLFCCIMYCIFAQPIHQPDQVS